MKKFTFILIYASFLMFVVNSYAQGTWTQKANYGGGSTYHAVGCSIGNKGYVGTGLYTADFWEWDQSTNLWTQKADFGGGGREWASCFTIGNKVYVGTGGLPDNNDFWEWDQSTNVWTQKASLGAVDSNGVGVQGRLGAVAFSLGGKGYVGTGNSNGYCISDFWEYDPVLDSWTQKANFGGGIRYGAVSFTIGNKAYVGTGGDALGGFYNDFWEYDPIADTWTQIAKFPGIGRVSATSFVIGTTAYVGTGLLKNLPYFADDFWSWDQSTNQWTLSSPFPAGFRSKSVSFSIGNTGYIGTGSDSLNNEKGDFWEFSPACNVVAPHICMVTTDSITNYNYNIVYWDKTIYPNVDTFYVYRKDAISGNYFRIGAVSKYSLSQFTDTLFNIGGPNGGNPLYSSWMYKLSILDTCGFESPKSPYHQSMFVQQNGSNFSWNAYTVEVGQSNPVTGYSFFRDDNNTGDWNVLVNTLGLSTTDPNFASFPNGNWRIDALGFDCTPTTKALISINRAHSNTTKLFTVDASQISDLNSQLFIYPNPASNSITITNITCKTQIRLYDILGNLAIEKETESNMTLDISQLKQGIFTLVTQDSKRKTINKVAVTK